MLGYKKMLINLEACLAIKKIIFSMICLTLWACFSGRQNPYTEGVCSNRDSVKFPCRLDTSVVQEIMNASGRKSICSDSTFCIINEEPVIFFVSRIIESPQYCIKRWNQKKENKEDNPSIFVYVLFDVVEYAKLDSFLVWNKMETDVVTSNRCYNIKEGVFFK